MKYLNTFIRTKNLDKQMVMDYLGGKNPRKVYPLYHAPLIPTFAGAIDIFELCLLYTSPSPRDRTRSRMPSSA